MPLPYMRSTLTAVLGLSVLLATGLAASQSVPASKAMAPPVLAGDGQNGSIQALGQALLAAADKGEAAAVRDLLVRGAPVNAQDAQGSTPLLRATAGNHIAVARSLLLHGADVNLKNQQQDSAYLLAGAQGRLEIVRMALSYGADLKSLNRYGGTALIPACERGHVETAQALIAAGVNVDHVNRLGWTCLMEAVVLADGGPAHQAIIRSLIAAGADLNLPDKEGVTALAHARQRGQREVVQLLQAAGAK